MTATATVPGIVKGYALLVLGLTTSDEVLVFPVSQFRRVDGQLEVRPAIAQLLPALKSLDLWSGAQLLGAPADVLGGLSPLGYAESGRDTRGLLDYAQHVRRDWSAR